MKIFKITRQETISYIITLLITIPEVVYLGRNIFDLNGWLIILITVAILVLMTCFDFIIQKIKLKHAISVISFIVIALFSLYAVFYTEVVEYVDLFAISFTNGYMIDSVMNYVMLAVLSILNFYLNRVLVQIIKSYFVVLVKTITILTIMWYFYKTSDFYTTFVFAALTIFIFLEAITSYISKLRNARSISLQVSLVSVYVLCLALVIASMTHLATDPFKFIDDLDLFESENGIPSPRIDKQDKITNFNANFNYSDSVVFVVNSPYYMKLRGTAFDVYESQNWTVSEEFENEVIDYSEELRRKTEFLDSYNVNYTEFFIEVEHNVYSKVLYTPTDSYIFDNEYDIKSSISNFFYTTEELDKNAIYTVSTIKIDKYSVAFTSMMKSLEAGNISDKYLQLPDEFSEEVINLAQDITSEYDSVYEKALAIENYLSANHKYNLSPDEKPYYYDYVEFFLFKSQEGFCTHYASSMVTMLRSVGIPSRYVIGYVLDRDGLGSVNRGSEEDETFEGVERRYLITKRKSHAWVEVYFEGYGWLEFEPTTPYFRISTNTEIVIDLPKDPITPDEPEIEEKSYLIQTVTAIIVGLLLGLGAFFKFKPNHTTDQKIVKVWNKIEKVIRKHRRVDDTNLTARELLNEARLKDTKLLMALSIYEKACFSNQVCSENELEQMKDTLDYYKSLQKD